MTPSPWLRATLVLAAVCVPAAAANAQNPPADPAVIVSVTPGGVGYVTPTTGPNGVSADIGRWDTPYPYPDTGEYAPGLQPTGRSILTIAVDVHDGGLASFSYQFFTYDAGIYDWLDITLQTPTGNIALVSQLGKPGSDYGTYWQSAPIVRTQSLDQWRDQRVTFVFSTMQDGWGDQSMTRLTNFAIRTCQVPPLTEITDPEALSFEQGNTVDTAQLTAAMQANLTCLQQAVAAANGTVTVNSAYRPPPYQQHLREVWDRWNDLRNRRDPECAQLRAEAQQEFQRHELQLTQRPAAASAHTRGQAIDIRWTLPPGVSIDTLAAGCDLHRPLPRDPVHFIER
jgi:hypothetical protein